MKRGVFNNKRAMSPLIATVLLIAFAVAMGAMIMNWSTSLGETKGPDCSGIRLVMNPVFCHSENAIKINLKNSGTDVAGLKLKIADNDAESLVNIKNSELKKDDHLSKEIPFIKKSVTNIDLIALVEFENKIVECPRPSLQVIDLKSCGI